MGPLLSSNSTLRDAVGQIESARQRIAVVVDNSGRLTGTITDGDIRRAILSGKSLDCLAQDVCNTNPLTADVNLPENHLAEILSGEGLEAIPLIDSNGNFVRIIHISDFYTGPMAGGGEGFGAAIIMAGGEGKRLLPLTNNIPKPLIKVGGVPMIERSVKSLARARIPKIYISVNYLAHKIESHFEDGNKFGVKIYYLREKKKLGTAGALSLFPDEPDAPLLVINGDVLTGADYGNLLSFHHELGSTLTVAATEYYVDIPYGVLRVDGTRVRRIEEKPSQRFLCNAGIYALSPDALKFLPQNVPFDMPDLIDTIIAMGKGVNVFPLHEYWTDVGNVADLERAQHDIEKIETHND